MSCPGLLVPKSLPVHYVDIVWAEAGRPSRKLLETNLLSAASRVVLWTPYPLWMPPSPAVTCPWQRVWILAPRVPGLGG